MSSQAVERCARRELHALDEEVQPVVIAQRDGSAPFRIRESLIAWLTCNDRRKQDEHTSNPVCSLHWNRPAFAMADLATCFACEEKTKRMKERGGTDNSGADL